MRLQTSLQFLLANQIATHNPKRRMNLRTKERGPAFREYSSPQNPDLLYQASKKFAVLNTSSSKFSSAIFCASMQSPATRSPVGAKQSPRLRRVLISKTLRKRPFRIR